MGQETKCELRFDGKKWTGKALLETDDLIFRGEFRLSIPLKSIQSLEVEDGVLRVASPQGTAYFTLGAEAGKWAHKIRNPRTLADKLDVKPGMRVSLIGVANPLEGRTRDVTEGTAAKDSDLIFFGAAADKDLSKLRTLQKSLKRNGAIWVVYPKGKKEITELAVLHAGRQAGLVDTKIARFSDTHTAHKFVIPLAKR
ncbi:MAG: hypothetical protein ABSF54_17565 [Bryobacteraceae bacterium]|jgi:hypothetical protein